MDPPESTVIQFAQRRKEPPCGPPQVAPDIEPEHVSKSGL